MAKGNRGLPPSFKLDIPDQDGPVKLGDYLDEVDTAPVPRPAVPRPIQQHSPAPEPSPVAENVVEFPRPNVAAEEARRVPERAEAPPAPQESEPAAPRRRRRRIPKAPPRKQINTTPETQRMIDEIIDYVQTYSVQRDAKASEIFHALVLTLHESLEEMDLSNVPARGRWGTPTAQAFPISLKSTFKAAIAKSQKKNPR